MLFTGVAAPAIAQRPGAPDLTRLIETFRSEPSAAVADLIGLDDDVRTRVLQACRSKTAGRAQPLCSRHDLLTVAQLVLDAAVELINQHNQRASDFLEQGAWLLRGLLEDDKKFTPVEARFTSLWFSHAARSLLAQHYIDRAGKVLESGFRLTPESAELYVTRGAIAEIPQSWRASSVRGKDPTMVDPNLAPRITPPRSPGQGPQANPDSRDRRAQQDPLAEAANQYRQALRVDPAHVAAHLQLAWVHVRQRDGRATDDVSRAMANATTDDERYLGALLLAAVDEAKGRPDSALEHYRHAWKLGPRYQSGCTGLASALAATGDVDGAARTSVECMSIESAPDHPDPWLTLRFGISATATVEWLHEEARRR